jgi:hypothetical protein
MSWVGFELVIPTFEQSVTKYILDCMATMICIQNLKIVVYKSQVDVYLFAII